MLNRLISNSNADPTIVDEVRDARSDIKSDISTSANQVLAAIALANTSTSNTELDNIVDGTLVRDHCNIIVLRNIDFSANKNYFIIKQDKVMRNGKSERFDVYGDDVKTFPTLLITANGGRKYKSSIDPNRSFYYGVITGVSEQGKRDYEIIFRKLFNKPMPQQRLNEIAVEIGINTVAGVDLLDSTNWIIKPIDIRKALIEHGIDYK